MKKQLLNMLTIVSLVTIVTSCGNSTTEIAKPNRFVKVVQLENANGNKQVEFNGELKEKSDVNVAFRVGGQILELLVDEGDYVKEGQVIAQIDKRDYNIQLQSAKAQYKQIDGEYKRYKELYSQKKLPANTLEKLEAGYLSAKSGYEAAQNALADTELKAPFSGYVYKRHIHKFENVGPGLPIISLLDVSQLEVHFSLSESQVALVKNFETITCDVSNAGISEVEAKLLSVNEKSNGNDMFDVRLLIDNANNTSLKPGMSVKVKVQMPKVNQSYAMVPVEAVFYRDNAAYVWIYDTEKSNVSKQQVKVKVFANSGMLGVESGLSGNEQVVTAGVNSLTEKQQVRVL
ncbi:efflux RND transporter periplasmic adaptor subunit [Carboxylicivirga sp. N1Y90]|uniref:efflux RND transporter periplasmic adaptor subunit n=1 Tax=Carboxylicivirga fragile TaxID=3417571 RepID=UPI003D335FDB|nr:efflux RND transporter periplasmic adaptor subunit [Marinilabiliaceae bacterium N1Y90]